MSFQHDDLEAPQDLYQCVNDMFEKAPLWSAVKKRILQICIGLQPLNLSALELLTIVEEAVEKASNIPMGKKWHIITLIKHFNDKKDIKMDIAKISNKRS